MRLYDNGFAYIEDEFELIERGIRLLLQHFESRETADESSLVLRGLVITPADIERTLEPDAAPWNEDEDPLRQFRSERLDAERHMQKRVAASLKAGTKLPLAELSERLDLSAWERRCVLLALAAEFDSRCESWFGYLNDDVTLRMPTVELALKLLADSAQQVQSARGFLGEGSKLRRYCLAQLDTASGQTRSSLRQLMKLDQRIISLLLETERMDSRLSGVASRTDEKEALEPLLVGAQLQRALLQAVRSCRDLETGQSGYFPVIQLTGPAGGGKKLHVKHVSHALGQPLLIIHGQRLPAAGEALREKLRLLVREAIITGAALAFENTDALWAEESQAAESFKAFRAALSEYAAEGKSPVVFWLNREAKRREQLPLPETAAMLDIALPYPAAVERLFVWKQAANGKLADDLQSELADKYKFTPGQIQGTMRQAFRLAAMRGGDVPHTGELAEASRTQVQTRLSELADKLTPVRGWDDLVLPDDSFAQLKEACARFRYGETVYGRWGFGRKLPYGRGLSMLFAGPPGTGKTMAAEVMAKELGIELYRIDLSRIVSKYIGETEKNLREMFAEAENSGSILFFDEADSLFGKRTEVKDSHDRYANMEAAYLLQRIEAFDGVSILATNLQQNMDEAFLRRMQVIVQFPFPDAEGRERIFRGLLPEEAPVDAELDLPFLAERIDVAGGHIKNIVLSAAFLAAGEGRPIGMVQMIRAAQQEFKKMGKIVVREQFEPYA